MKLQELDALKNKQKVARILEDRLGQSASFDNLSRGQTRAMLTRIRGLIHEHRNTPEFHYSEKNAAYLKLVMLEQGLVGRLKEGEPGTIMVPMDTKDPKVQQTLQAAQKGAPLNPEQQKTISAIATQKTEAGKKFKRKRMVRESEIQQAQVVMAAQDMVDRLQKMMEDISSMQFKDLPALADSIKNDMGPEQATQFQQAAAGALTQLLAAVQQGKTQMEQAQGTLTGQAPTVPGADAGAGNMGAAPMPPEGGDELNPFAGGAEPPSPDEGETDELGNATSLGRERRGVAESRRRVATKKRK